MPYSKIRLTVGIFVLILFASILGMLYLVLDEKGTFNKRYSYNFTTNSAEFFTIGMPIKLSGFDIGSIDKIELNDDATVYVTFSVDEKNKKWITQGSVLVLSKPFIGSAHIDLHSAISNEVLKENSGVKMVQSNDINDLISKVEPIMDRVVHIIKNIDDITSYLARDDSDILITLQNLKKFSKNLSENRSLLTTITGDKKSTKSIIDALNKIKFIVKDLHKISSDVSAITSKLDDDVLKPTSSAMVELDKIMKDVKRKLDVIDSTVNVIGDYDSDLVELKEQVSSGVQKSDEIIEKIDALLQDEAKEEIELP